VLSGAPTRAPHPPLPDCAASLVPSTDRVVSLAVIAGKGQSGRDATFSPLGPGGEGETEDGAHAASLSRCGVQRVARAAAWRLL